MNEQKKDNLLTIEDLVVEYDTNEAVVQAVNHVSLQLGRGETLGQSPHAVSYRPRTGADIPHNAPRESQPSQACPQPFFPHLKKRLNTSMILITHDLGIVAGMCDKVAVVYAGEIVEQGTTEEIFDHPEHPYTVGLFQSLPRLELTCVTSLPSKRICPPVDSSR